MNPAQFKRSNNIKNPRPPSQNNSFFSPDLHFSMIVLRNALAVKIMQYHSPSLDIYAKQPNFTVLSSMFTSSESQGKLSKGIVNYKSILKKCIKYLHFLFDIDLIRWAILFHF